MPSPLRASAVARRASISMLLGFALLLAAADRAGAQVPAPPAQFTAVAPANRSTVTLKPDANVTFRWRVSWPEGPTTGTVIISFQIAADRYFTQSTTENYACPAQALNCWANYTPNRAYGPPWGKTWYWRVSVTGGGTSPVYSFKAVELGDGVKPRVRVLGGSAHRGSTALFRARLADNRGSVRTRATLTYKGHALLTGAFTYTTVAWGVPFSFWSERPLPRSMPAGVYQFCVVAWDRAGNRARGCAAYRIR